MDAAVSSKRDSPVLIRRIRYPHHGEQRERCFAIVNGEPEPTTCQELPGAGDLVASATKAVGVKPCGGCKRRQAALNAATPGWLRRSLAWIARAISRF